ncbi:hypothetical protein KSF78_0000737 [Schistosoma japonicum]|nr:hypothetical protein KSF78_0000737 [Schistosoma japonicum]
MVKITNIGFTNITMQQRKDGSIQKIICLVYCTYYLLSSGL